jgi:hypothetical protein
MKQPLIEIVQTIMNDIDGDFVNSIADTEESLQVASIVRTTFYELFNRKQWAHSKTINKLQGLSNSEYPTYLKLPENLYHLDELTYDKSRLNDTRLLLQTVKWREPEHFLRLTNEFNVQNDNVEVKQTLNGVTLKIMNDRPPRYYTTFDDQHLVLDSYDSEVDSVLQSDKTQAIYYEIPDFLMEDTFIPKLPLEAFPYLIAEATSAASLKVRQMEDAKAEQQAKRQSVRASQRSRRAASGTRYPDYGRRSGKGATIRYKLPHVDNGGYDG